MILGFSHVQLVVRDVAASTAWYAQVLELEQFVSGAIDTGPYAALRHPSAAFVVGMQTKPVDAGCEQGSGIDHLSFAVGDFDELLARRRALIDAGLSPSEVIEEAVSYNVRVCDPDGMVVELTCPKRRTG